jgi:hypothetical protein
MTLPFRQSRRLARRIAALASLALAGPLASFAPCAAFAAVTAFAATASPQTIPPPPSRPPPPASLLVNAEIMVLHAANLPGSGSIDPAIGNLPQLRNPPLSAYNTYELIGRRTLPILAGNSATYPLPNGRVLQVTFVGPTSDHGFHVKTAINQPGGNAFLKLLELTAKPNEPFFVAGQTYKGGNMVLAINLRP